jgi:hypothetical protein
MKTIEWLWCEPLLKLSDLVERKLIFADTASNMFHQQVENNSIYIIEAHAIEAF